MTEAKSTTRPAGPTGGPAKEPALPGGQYRCRACRYEGTMGRWLRSSRKAQVAAVVLLVLGGVPGLIFLSWGWGKRVCPRCGSIRNFRLVRKYIL